MDFLTSCSVRSEPIKKNESYYQKTLCTALNRQTEYVLFDKTQVDCLTKEFAIDVDW